MGIIRVHRRDGNHAAIVKGLKAVGASVQTLSQVGRGCPDLLIGFRGVNVLLELKDGAAKDKRQHLLNEAEQEWHRSWGGQVVVVKSLDEALTAIGASK
jgi:hypothetical protein